MMSNMLPVHYAPEIPDDWVSLSGGGRFYRLPLFHGFPEEGILSVVVLHFILTGISRVLGDLPEIKFVRGNSSFVVRDAFHGVVGSPVLDVNVICFP